MPSTRAADAFGACIAFFGEVPEFTEDPTLLTGSGFFSGWY